MDPIGNTIHLLGALFTIAYLYVNGIQVIRRKQYRQAHPITNDDLTN